MFKCHVFIFGSGIYLVKGAGTGVDLCFNYLSMLILMANHKFEEAEILTVQHMDRHRQADIIRHPRLPPFTR